MKKGLLFLCIIWMNFVFAQAPAPSFQWLKSVKANGATSTNYGTSEGDIACDPSGNIIYFGNAQGDTITLDTIQYHTSPTTYWYSAVVAKYSPTGNVVWAKPLSSAINIVKGKVDATGNIYLLGTQGLLDSIIIDGVTIYSGAFVMKMNNNGTVLWANGFTMDWNHDGLDGLAIDSLGNNIYIAGDFYSTNFNFGNSVALSNYTGTQEGFVVKYNSFGVAQWAKAIWGGSIYPNDICTDKQADLIIIGDGGDTYGPISVSGTLVNNVPNYTVPFMAKFKSADGTVLWANNTGTRFTSITTDINSSIYVGGGDGNTVKKYSSEGTVLWQMSNTNTYYGKTTIDKNNNLIFCGTYNNTISLGNYTLTPLMGNIGGAYIAKCDTLGNIIWARVINTGANSIALGQNGVYYLGGAFATPTLSFDSYTVQNTSGHGNFYFASLLACGAPYGYAGQDTAICLNNSISLYAYGGQTYVWSPSYGLSNPNIPNPIASPTVTTQYTVSVTNQCGSTTDVMKLNVRTQPLIGVAGSGTVCSTASTTLTATGVNSYTWMPGGITTNTISVHPTSNTTYTLIGGLGNCIGSITHPLVVMPAPNVEILIDTGCYSRWNTLRALGATSYTWSTGSLYDTARIYGQVNNQTYTLTGFDGTCYNTSTYTFPLSYYPGATANTCSAMYCYGQVNTNPIGCLGYPSGTQMIWTNDNPTIGIAAHGNGTSIPAPTPITSLSPITQTATIVGYPDLNGCKGDSFSITVTVKGVPFFDSLPTQVVCSGAFFQGITFSSNPSPDYYQWSNTNTSFGIASYDSWSSGSTTGDINGFSVPNLTSTQQAIISIHGYVNMAGGGACYGPTQTYTVIATPSCVWAGDADENLVVDNTDLLSVGIKYGMTGNARSSVSNMWQGMSCLDWNDTLNNGANTKFTDCDGSGIIDLNDTLAINLNYNQTHSARYAAPKCIQNTNSDVYVQYNKTQYFLGDTVNADIYIGRSSSPQNNFYGAAFTIQYDNNSVVNGSEKFWFNDSWAGTINQSEIKFSKINSSMGIVDASLVRTTHTNVNGYGKVATLQYVLNTSTSATSLSTTISNIIKTDSDGNHTSLFGGTDTVIVIQSTTGLNQLTEEPLIIYPNPTSGIISLKANNNKVLGTVELYNSIGETVFKLNNKSSFASIDISQFAPGLYTIVVQHKYYKVIKQ